MKVGGKRVTLKWNESTHFYQPPRAHHCSVSNDCVEKFDHHCPWVGATIGQARPLRSHCAISGPHPLPSQRNYRFFLLFVFNTTLLCFYTFALSVTQLHLKYVALQAQHRAQPSQPAASVSLAMRRCPAAVAMCCYTFVFVWFVGGLSGFHAYLVATNQTTYENFRYAYGRGENPFDRGCVENCCEAFCAPRLPRKVDFRALVADVEMQPPAVDRMGRWAGGQQAAPVSCAGRPLEVVELVSQTVAQHP